MSQDTHTHTLVSAIESALETNAQVRAQVAGALASLYTHIGQEANAQAYAKFMAMETLESHVQAHAGDADASALAVQLIDLDERIHVRIASGYPVEKRGNRYYARTCVGTLPVAKKFVTKGHTNARLERSAPVRKDNAWALDEKIGTILTKSMANADADTHSETNADADAHSAPSKAEQKATKAQAREEKWRKLHESEQCTCTSTGHGCPFVRDYGGKNRFDQ